MKEKGVRKYAMIKERKPKKKQEKNVNDEITLTHTNVQYESTIQEFDDGNTQNGIQSVNIDDKKEIKNDNQEKSITATVFETTNRNEAQKNEDDDIASVEEFIRYLFVDESIKNKSKYQIKSKSKKKKNKKKNKSAQGLKNISYKPISTHHRESLITLGEDYETDTNSEIENDYQNSHEEKYENYIKKHFSHTFLDYCIGLVAILKAVHLILEKSGVIDSSSKVSSISSFTNSILMFISSFLWFYKHQKSKDQAKEFFWIFILIYVVIFYWMLKFHGMIDYEESLFDSWSLKKFFIY